jgi:hypothetical protein
MALLSLLDVTVMVVVPELKTRRLEPRLALSGATVVVLDVFGRYNDGGGGGGCTRGLFNRK